MHIARPNEREHAKKTRRGLITLIDHRLTRAPAITDATRYSQSRAAAARAFTFTIHAFTASDARDVFQTDSSSSSSAVVALRKSARAACLLSYDNKHASVSVNGISEAKNPLSSAAFVLLEARGRRCSSCEGDGRAQIPREPPLPQPPREPYAAPQDLAPPPAW